MNGVRAIRRASLRLLLPGFLLTRTLAGESGVARSGPDGLWTGHWIRDGSALEVEMTFSSTGPGHIGSFSSRQLRVVGVPLTRITFEAPVLRWEIVGDESTSTFEGLLRGDTLSGTFRDGSASGTFAFTRGATTDAPLREDEITFANGPVVLSGTIVFPPGLGPFPGMVFPWVRRGGPLGLSLSGA